VSDGPVAPAATTTGAAAILAGGRGRRLGGAVKPLLVVEGRRIIDRQLAVLRKLFSRLVIVAPDPAPFAGLDLPVIPDRAGPGLGPLAGLDAALGWLPAQIPALVCVAGDMPHLAPAVLRHLRDADPAARALVPRLATGPEPLCARYHRDLGPLVADQLARGALAMQALVARAGATFIDEPELRRLDPTLRTFTSVNTPADLSGS
jgi:molybdopterin-guanine dinucleotide biosynthesis protein A